MKSERMKGDRNITGMLRKCCKLLLVFSFPFFLIFSCESFDCTLNNVVVCKYAFYSADGQNVTVLDTLTVTTEGSDSILYNRGSNVSSLSLPMSHWQEADTLNFYFYNAESQTTQKVVIRVKKTNTQHFEAPDCPTTMFHELQSIDFDSPTQCVDSIVISNTAVNYESQENIKIYLHTAAE